MKNVLNKIENRRIAYWNFAADGIWEKSIEVRTSAGDEDLEKLKNWVLSNSADIALEAFFDDESGERFFLGVRIAAFEKQRQIDFLNELVRSVPANATFKEVLQALAFALGDDNLFAEQPDFLELGVVNAWKSTGSFIIWRKGDEAALDIQDIEAGAPQLLKTHSNPVTLEMAWKKPLPHWLGLPVSQKQNAGYKLDTSKYQLVAQDII